MRGASLSDTQPAPPLVACPQCGGSNALPSGAQLLRCAFCGGSLAVDRGGLVFHYRLPRLLDRAHAEQALRRWAAGNETVKHLDREARIETLEPALFPLWLFRGQASGRELTRAEPAAATPVPQLSDLDLPAGQLAAFTPEPGVDATPPSVPLATARQWLEQLGGVEVCEDALVHVPLWRCEYSYRGRRYAALVDGSTGAVYAAVYPAKSESPYLLVAALGLAIFSIEGLIAPNLFVRLLVIGVTAVPFFFAAYAVARRV